MCGVIAIMFAVDRTQHSTQISMLLILMGMVFDGLDGYLARKFSVSTEFGEKLDSVSDMITFCIAPAILIYANYYEQGISALYSMSNAVVVIASSLAMGMGGIRLALHEGKAQSFRGLPSSAYAFAILLFIALQSPYTPMISIILSMAMVAPVDYKKPRGTLAIFALLLIIYTMFVLALTSLFPHPSMGYEYLYLPLICAALYIISPVYLR